MLRVDELIFDCFAPVRVKVLVREARPLDAPPLIKSRGGLDFRSLASFIVCLGLCLFFFFGALSSNIQNYERAQHAMCGGDLDMVYTVDGLGVPWWAPVTARETRGHARVPGSDHRPTKDFPGPGDDRLARTNFPNGETDSQLRKQDANTPAPGGARTNRGKLPRRAPRRREAAHHVSYAGAL